MNFLKNLSENTDKVGGDFHWLPASNETLELDDQVFLDKDYKSYATFPASSLLHG